MVIGEIDFVSVNSTYTYGLTEGVNVCDGFNDGFCKHRHWRGPVGAPPATGFRDPPRRSLRGLITSAFRPECR